MFRRENSAMLMVILKEVITEIKGLNNSITKKEETQKEK